jgi:tryptophanyl-tRNA synthetase
MSTLAASEVTERDTLLTGDRPTGPLHLGHLVGSLRTRVACQGRCRQFVMLADAQALTDNMDEPAKVRRNVVEVALDYLAVGLDAEASTIFVQSAVPELAELAFYFLNLVSVARLERNPTVKEEVRQRGFERAIPAGFLAYPVSQAADIAAFQATLVPVGADQLPMIEQTNEIVRRFNRIAGRPLLRGTRALLSSVGRLPGLDGSAKMSKSLGNAISLSASPAEIRNAVRSIYTDPLHLHPEDIGHLEGNVAFIYLDAFDQDAAGLADLKQRYVSGGVPDSVVKARLEDCLQALLRPIRETRSRFAEDRGQVLQMLRQGSSRAREVAATTVDGVKQALGVGLLA